MTLAELAAARALCEAASPGPWIASKHHLAVETAQLANDGTVYGNLMWVVEPGDADDEHGRVAEFDRSAAFIAASRTLVPDLIAEVDRLRSERDEARALLPTETEFEVLKRASVRYTMSADLLDYIDRLLAVTCARTMDLALPIQEHS